jgi:hypothetical protein
MGKALEHWSAGKRGLSAATELPLRWANMEWQVSPIFRLTTTHASVNIETLDRLNMVRARFAGAGYWSASLAKS